ncbi:lactate utilization protein C [Sporolactobacillus shoreae]|uniref:Lactate utilization protein C n=1 Tax=Sporolactobacillus shoreae TaxID=1465501 RepID=A0A4Z0GJS4_9BACL|nr:lactate utilization protein C [Sporolactobacillus shoreae]TGA96166.1 lactate utilization protein C [Sporolactobacillus shoreae]
MSGTIENREAFLENIAKKLNRESGALVETPDWTNQPQWAVYQNSSKDQLVEIMKKASELIHTTIFETTADQLADTLDNAITEYGGAPVIATNDHRFSDFGLTDVLRKSDAYIWNVNNGHKNIDVAAQANIGISIADVMLAESATAGLFNDKDKARSVSLLPVTSIVIVPKSLIVPRLTQAMQMVEKKVEEGSEISHYINFISGPSNSADIEMRLVVGVHGPVKVAYIVVHDL